MHQGFVMVAPENTAAGGAARTLGAWQRRQRLSHCRLNVNHSQAFGGSTERNFLSSAWEEADVTGLSVPFCVAEQ